MCVELRTLSLKSKSQITWGLMWRAFVIGILSFVISLPAGVFVGFAAAAMGLETPMVFAIPLGVLIGGVSYYYFIKWTIGTNIGGYKIVLIKSE